jgi:hypothetical protein
MNLSTGEQRRQRVQHEEPKATVTHEEPVTPRFARAVLRGGRDLEQCANSDVLEIPAPSQHDSPAHRAGDVTG